jgi:hypothetical protein
MTLRDVIAYLDDFGLEAVAYYAENDAWLPVE